ncbi:MAG: DUF4922 domain-containing protein [Bacteroidales bacterium]|nr:DUF4922 domain-containing protein [Bacteroidales bacterium]
MFADHPGILNLKKQAEALFDDQLQNWDLAKANYRSLQKVVTKHLPFSGQAEIRVQYNPERIYSTSAKVDPKSVSERPCFLCPVFLPQKQKAVPFKHDYLVLVNPFPIFPRHLTIPYKDHIPQQLSGRFSDMLDLARALDDFVVFYNGPRCGASAPDHFHFQAGIKGFMPIDDDFEKPLKVLLGEQNGSKIWSLENYLRHILVFSSPDPQWLEEKLSHAVRVLSEFDKGHDEPMMNVLASWNDDHWRIFLFPRKAHRPWQFFAEGPQQILLSPAAVDMGGVLIIPRQEDFDKLNLQSSQDIFSQVTLEAEHWEQLKSALLKSFYDGS